MKLELGYNQPPEIRHYAYPFEPLAGKRLLYISDLHYHRVSRRRVDQHIRQIKDIDPHLLLLGGDYIDTPFGLPNLRHLLTSLGSIPRYAIGGNHDAPWLARVRQTPNGLYPVKWRYKWNILDKTYGRCYYILSKGLGDTFPIRYNCRRDAILVTFGPNPRTP